MNIAERTIDAALRVLSEAPASEVFAFLTQERLHREIPADGLGGAPDRRRIAEQFADCGRFSTETVVHRALVVALGEMIAPGGGELGGLSAAGAAAPDPTRALTELAAAVTTAGEDATADVDARAQARDRLLILCVGLADGDRRIARIVRDHVSEQTRARVGDDAYEAQLARLGRVLRPGIDASQLHTSIRAYERGTRFYARCELLPEPPRRLRALLGIVWAHSAPARAPESPTLHELVALLTARPVSAPPRPVGGSSTRIGADNRTIGAARRLLTGVELSELLGFLTLERLHREISADGLAGRPDRRRIAREFSEGGRFSTTRLVDRALAASLARMRELAVDNTDRYVEAVSQPDVIRLVAGMVAALIDDWTDFEPTGEDGHRNGRERLFYFAVALADSDRRLAPSIRGYVERHTDLYVRSGIYEKGLTALGRGWAPGVTAAQLHLALHTYLRGITFYERCGVMTPRSICAHAIAGMIWSYTVPAHDPESPTLAEFLSAIPQPPSPV